MKISTFSTFLFALAGSCLLSGTEIAGDTLPKTHAAPVAAPKFSGAAEARVRALENFMTARTCRNRNKRLALLVEVLRDDPAAVLPRNNIRGLVMTRADARQVASKLLDLCRKHPRQLGLAALAGQMCYAANLVPSVYLNAMRTVLDDVTDPALLSQANKVEFYSIVGAYSSALKQARDYRTGTDFFQSQLACEESPFRDTMLRFAIDFEYFFSRYGKRDSRWLGLADSDRVAAKKRFEKLFGEFESREKELPAKELNSYIEFCLAVGKTAPALRAAERLTATTPIPQNKTRLAYVAIEAKAFDKVPPIVAELVKLNGWKGVSQLITINSLIAQRKYGEAKTKIGELRVPIARDEFMLKVLQAQKDYKGMRKQLNEMEKHLSPGVDIDLANAVRQVAVAQELGDVKLLNRIWKLLIDTKQIESPEAANTVGYVAAALNVRLDEAKKLIVYALEAEPDNYAYLDSMAWICFRQKNYADAETYIHRALRASEQDVGRGIIYEHLGDILLAQGKKSEALAAYREALDYPKDEDFDPAVIQEKCKNLE